MAKREDSTVVAARSQPPTVGLSPSRFGLNRHSSNTMMNSLTVDAAQVAAQPTNTRDAKGHSISRQDASQLQGSQTPRNSSVFDFRAAAPATTSSADAAYDSEVDQYGSPGEETLPAAKAKSRNNVTVSHFDLCACLYKRRGGFGRNKEKNWVKRVFTLYGSVLCYYDDCDIKKVDPSKPRGRLNLLKDDTVAEMHTKHKHDAPTEFLLTVNIYVLGGKRKWEMCCQDRTQQVGWYDAIRPFDGKPLVEPGIFQSLGDSMMSPGQSKLSPRPGWKSQLKSNSFNGAHMTQALTERHVSDDAMTSSTTPRKNSTAESTKRCSAVKHSVDKTALVERRANTLFTMPVVLSLATLNTSAYFMRSGTAQVFWFALTISNFVIYYLLSQLTKNLASTSPAYGLEGGPTAVDSQAMPAASLYGSNPKSPNEVLASAAFQKIVPAGSTMVRAPVKPGSKLAETVQQCGQSSATTIRAYAAAGPDQYDETMSHCYWNSDASNFHLRIGPNYKKNRLKAPSDRALYDLYSMDFVRAESVLEQVSDGFNLPSIPGITDAKTGNDFVPPMIVFNVWLPADEPHLFSRTANGPTFVIVMYFVITEQTLRELKNLDLARPAVKLLAEWCEKAETDEEFRGRFKCMGIVEKIEETGIPSFVAGYNGKPTLVTKSGNAKRCSNYIEMTANVRTWAYVARKGLFALMPKFSSIVLNFGCTIEARKDHELPEVLLGGCRILRIDPDKVLVDGVDTTDSASAADEKRYDKKE